jgi:hypothetical protein
MATIKEDDDDNVAAVEATEGADVDVGQDDKGAKEPPVEVIEDDGKGGEDDRYHADASGDDDDEPPRRQRETAAERRARAKLAKERDKKELDFQRRELARQDALIRDLQKGQTVSRVTELDNRISTAQNEAATYDSIHYKAIIAKNEADARAAADIRDAAKQRAWDAHQEKQRLIQEANRPQPKPVPYLDKAQTFMSEVPWYDVKGSDQDSRIVTEIDNEVAKEYIPTSDAYWNELRRRVKKNLPHRFESGSTDDGDTDTQRDTRQRRAPPTGGSSRSNSSTNGTQIRLSAERVAAMKEAGLWEDPKTRAKMAKTYANYDKNSG